MHMCEEYLVMTYWGPNVKWSDDKNTFSCSQQDLQTVHTCVVMRCVCAMVNQLRVRRKWGTNLIWFCNEWTSRATTYVNRENELVCNICLFFHRRTIFPFKWHPWTFFILFIYLCFILRCCFFLQITWHRMVGWLHNDELEE